MSPATVAPPDLTRVVLFLGLVLHKGLWEALKARTTAARRRDAAAPSPRVRAVKALKVLVLGGLAVQTLFLDLLPIGGRGAPLRATGLALYGLGLVLAVSGRLGLGRNWADLEDAGLLPGQALVDRGVYRFIRHPIYAGDLFLLFGLELALGSWLVLAVLGPLLVVVRQALREEALLARSLPGYRVYCARTKRFIPFVV